MICNCSIACINPGAILGFWWDSQMESPDPDPRQSQIAFWEGIHCSSVLAWLRIWKFQKSSPPWVDPLSFLGTSKEKHIKLFFCKILLPPRPGRDMGATGRVTKINNFFKKYFFLVMCPKWKMDPHRELNFSILSKF